MSEKSNMYANTKTWSPFKGCRFDCIYCEPSFKKQAKRQMRLCSDCYNYVPHCHEERLRKIPSADIVFVCGNADIAFCPPEFTRKMTDDMLRGARKQTSKSTSQSSNLVEAAQLEAVAEMLDGLDTYRVEWTKSHFESWKELNQK